MIGSGTADISGNRAFSPRVGLSRRASGEEQIGCRIIHRGSTMEQNGDLRMNPTVLCLRTQ